MITPVDQGDLSREVDDHADAALRAVRVVLGVLSCFILGAYRPLTGSVVWGSLTLVILAIIGTVAGLNILSKRVPRRPVWLASTQILDIVAIAGLVIALDEPLGHDSWVLLLVPVVSAAVRLNTTSSFLSWLGGCALYLAAAATGALSRPDTATLLIRIPGCLLAIAITVGLLARWMREGWEIQNELTATISARESRLAIIEQTQQALAGLDAIEALKVCANQIIALGFDAAAVQPRNHDQSAYVLGRGEVIAVTTPSKNEPSNRPVVTSWTENDQFVVHSVCVHERHTRAALTGWSLQPINQDQVQALVALVAHTSMAIESSNLLYKLRHTAAHDALTGLANRRSFDSDLQRRATKSGPLSVLFIDLDGFKPINDEHGHPVGDQVLVAMAGRLRNTAGSDGIVARYGGDEFVILLPGADMDQALKVAEAVLETSTHPIAIDSKQLAVGLSIGIASAVGPLASADLVAVADQAVYQAKAKGRGKIVAIDVDEPEAGPQPSSEFVTSA